MAHRFTNQLINESSLYLRQHAHNPVNWYPWGEEALQKARQEDKPILISIGYAACHWCHVMERESFEDEQVADFMNRHFINIKIDREERPDLDHIYMDAVQAMSGSGGWPLNVFCTPDTKPFFGGTYFPPRQAFNRISWIELLQRIQQAWEQKRDGLEQQAGRILEHISRSVQLQAAHGEAFSADTCRQMTAAIMEAADKVKGGFGAAPKFPHTLTIRYLLEYGKQFNDDEAIRQAECSLKAMIRGGIYDHLGGGLARYSTDDDWLVPHFEKMLYDNALLISALSIAFQQTGDREYADCIEKTFRFLQSELRDVSGGYYSAIDADSEGEEGKFYVWEKSEIEWLLGKEADLYGKWFGVTSEGNWEGRNILHIHTDPKAFAEKNGIDAGSMNELIQRGNDKLMRHRSQRVRPLTDDKILSGWNALLVSGLCRAFAATGNDEYRKEAEGLASFIFRSFEKNGDWLHCYHLGSIKHSAFLDDIAYITEACILLQEISGDQFYLEQAERFMQYADKYFLQEGGFYCYTDSRMNDLLFRKTEYYDGAMPSGNSTMAFNLFYLGRILDKPGYEKKSKQLISSMSQLCTKYPVSFSIWSLLLMYKSIKNIDLVLVGTNISAMRTGLLKFFLPGRIFQSSERPLDFPLLRGKPCPEKPNIYLCINKLCLEPISDISSLGKLLETHQS